MILPVGTLIQNKYSKMKVEEWLDEDGNQTDNSDELVQYICICTEASEQSAISTGDRFGMTRQRLEDAIASGARHVITMGEWSTSNPNKLGNFPRKGEYDDE